MGICRGDGAAGYPVRFIESWSNHFVIHELSGGSGAGAKSWETFPGSVEESLPPSASQPYTYISCLLCVPAQFIRHGSENHVEEVKNQMSPWGLVHWVVSAEDHTE